METHLYSSFNEVKSTQDTFDYLGQVFASQDQEHRMHIEPLLGPDSDWENPAAMMEPAKSIGLAYVVSQERSQGKALTFAHNSHLKRGRAEWQLGNDLLTWWPAGAHLFETFGQSYAVIGTGVGIYDANGICRPEAGTLEARLTALPGQRGSFPLTKARGLQPLK